MYGKKARQGLLEKLDYELWMLNKLAENQIFDGGTEIATIKIRSGDTPLEIDLDSGVVDVFSRSFTIMTPLVFTAAYKMLDMIFEWILEENYRAGKISKVPWRFQDKLKLVKGKSKLQYPLLFTTQKYLHSYSEALFRSLLRYRNEIVHNNAFSVCGGQLILSDPKKNTQLTLDRVQLGRLVRYVVTVARGLSGDIEVDTHIDRLLKYCLDSLKDAHGMATFNQDKPFIVNVEYAVNEKCSPYHVNLKNARDRIGTTFPNRDVSFNLTVSALDGENLIAKWYFKEGDVPSSDELILDDESHKAHRVDGSP